MFWLRNKENNFTIRTLIWRSGLLSGFAISLLKMLCLFILLLLCECLFSVVFPCIFLPPLVGLWFVIVAFLVLLFLFSCVLSLQLALKTLF